MTGGPELLNLFDRFRSALGTSGSQAAPSDVDLPAFLEDFSIECMPRTAEKIDDFRDLLPTGTRVYIAHIEGTEFEDMVATAARLSREGFRPMPHFPARLIPDRATLREMIARYQGEAGVEQGLLLAGGAREPAGLFDSSIAMIETGLFDEAGFTRLHVAGHPEGNRDIDPNGGTANVETALKWKAAFAERTDAQMAIVTQFSFDPEPIITWAHSVEQAGIGLPIHIGIAGPAKLQTLIRFAIACGVGPSLSVLQRRAGDVSKLLLPYEPTDFLAALARHKAAHPDFNIARVHVFPLGGLRAASEWTKAHAGPHGVPANG
ncbi:methylenetetrahydrofolate reductase (NADPH) [Poseidonocella pacifica]|uniref:Methylenetetrahydrofolate reductase (NADPH) n=1 Tax=Poseidonocella pacifica TaxID=871651 RepID=A0A1I0VHP9_9RHOB|nr:methylenetetrahydrofolate reductase [Poseidonocella pacifica]SFA75841.1 methylenetetrahydrofolate reductase (NADPH) [Poseidonocella pacifica]